MEIGTSFPQTIFSGQNGSIAKPVSDDAVALPPLDPVDISSFNVTNRNTDAGKLDEDLKSKMSMKDYIAYIDEQYNSDRLTGILTTLTDMIGATVLNISQQDYEPQGASVTLLIAEGSMVPVAGETKVAHLDKSHVTVHTYPEYHPETCLATFRVDIDVATCGEITPLSTLDYLIGSFDSDIITMDYRVRGFTRAMDGKKLFMDHRVKSIQDYIAEETLRRYDVVDINVYEANLFHTKMMVKDIDLQNYLFKTDVYELPPKTRLSIMDSLRREMIEIFSGRNIY